MNIKNLDLQPLTDVEMKETNGGWGWWYEIVSAIWSNRDAVGDAYAQVIREGGTTCDMMPFK